MTDFGSDVSTFPDLDPTFSPITGRRAVGEAIARRLETPRGGGLFYNPAYGYDLRSAMNSAQSPSSLAAIAAAVENEAVQDERVSAATATVTLDNATNIMRVSLALETAEGPFALVLAISAVSVDVLKVQ